MKTNESKIYNAVGHIFMSILALIALIPIVLMVVSSLTDNDALLNNGYSFIPEKWSTYAYQWIFESNGGVVIKAYGMSFLLTGIGVIISLTK